MITDLFEIDNSPLTVAAVAKQAANNESSLKNSALNDNEIEKSDVGGESTEAATSHVSGMVNPLKGLIGIGSQAKQRISQVRLDPIDGKQVSRNSN